jgi:hypothetical protein
MSNLSSKRRKALKMDSKDYGGFVYRELFLGVDIFFAPVGDINRYEEGRSF